MTESKPNNTPLVVGAAAYLKAQYKVVIGVFIALFIIFLVLAFGFNVQNKVVPFAFLTGGFFSGLCGFFGMKAATNASLRSTPNSFTIISSTSVKWLM